MKCYKKAEKSVLVLGVLMVLVAPLFAEQVYARQQVEDSLRTLLQTETDPELRFELYSDLYNNVLENDQSMSEDVFAEWVSGLEAEGNLSRLGEAYRLKGVALDNDSAEERQEVFYRALSYAEEASDSMLISNVLMGMGRIVIDTPSGQAFFARASAIYMDLGDSTKAASAKDQQAVSSERAGEQMEVTDSLFQVAISMMPMDIDPAFKARTINNRAYMRYKQGDFAGALPGFEEAIAVHFEHSPPEIQPTRLHIYMLTNLGKALLGLGRLKEAQTHLDRAYQWAVALEAIGSRYYWQSLQYVTEARHELYARLSDYNTAYENYRIHQAMTDSLNVNELALAQVRADAQYATEKRLLAAEAEEKQRTAILRLIIGFILVSLAIVTTFSVNLVRRYRQIQMQKEVITKQHKRMENELAFGRKVQMSMMPSGLSTLPERYNVDLHAALVPARELGGDFYDYFMVDERHLCFVVGDVSDKGVPSALLMAVAKTMIGSSAREHGTSSSIVRTLNDKISENNDESMFITLLLGILDVETGIICFTNAGHNPPYLYRKTGMLERIADRHGPVVGAMPGLDFRESELQLEIGDLLMCYTDGVTEAMSPEGELFGEERLKAFVSELDDQAPAERYVSGLMSGVQMFESGGQRSDDITMLAFRRTAS